MARHSQYAIFCRNNRQEILISQKQVISFEAISKEKAQLTSLKQLLANGQLVFTGDGHVEGDVKGRVYLTRLRGTLLPAGGQFCIPGGREINGSGGLNKALKVL